MEFAHPDLERWLLVTTHRLRTTLQEFTAGVLFVAFDVWESSVSVMKMQAMIQVIYYRIGGWCHWQNCSCSKMDSTLSLLKMLIDIDKTTPSQNELSSEYKALRRT
jgi:hypothetical protein